MSHEPDPPVQFRFAAPADAGTLAELLHAFNSEFGVPTPPAPVLQARLLRHLGTGALRGVLAEQGEAAIGMALLCPRVSVWYEGGVAILDELYLAPDQRGQGIGTQLLRCVEEHLIAEGFACVEINVDGEDHDARRFYERHGYRNREPGETEQLLYYYRELTP